MNRIYKLILDCQVFGTSLLEKADAPMGVVFVAINFSNKDYRYEYFKNYCLSKRIDFTSDFPKHKLLSTSPRLRRPKPTLTL